MTPQSLGAALAVFQKSGSDFTIRNLQVLLALPAPGSNLMYSVVDLAEQLQEDRPACSRAASFLVNELLAVRKENSADRRFVILHRTAKGHALLAKALKAGET